MSNPDIPENDTTVEATTESSESFDAILSQFEQTHSHRSAEGGRQLSGTVVAVSPEFVFVDIGYKIEGVLPAALFEDAKETVEPGTILQVSVKGRNEAGYYELSRLRVETPKDWSALEQAFADKATIVGTVTGVVKGGLTVDVGVRAFMPGSRSGARDAAEMERLVGQEIRCRIIKVDATEEDVVVDRRAVVEEEDRSTRERRYSEIREGDTVSGTVRSLTDYGAFVDIGGVDGLLHIGDIAWSRIEKPADVLTVGQQIDAKVLKVEPSGKRISLGMKQLLPHPWDAVAGKYTAGERVRGKVTRVADFGAFVELEPGIEGMIHLSEMSWAKKVKKARRYGQARRCGRGNDSRRECSRTPNVPWIEADSGRSMDGCVGEVRCRFRGGGRDYQLHEVRRLCAACRRSRGDDSRQRDQRREED